MAFLKRKERVAVYIDGSNFYNYLKDKEINFPKGKKFNFKAFVESLVGDRECVSKRYYTGFLEILITLLKAKP